MIYVIFLSFFLSLEIGRITAQSTNTTCVSNSTTSWLFNSNGESPCLVWSRLQYLCLDSSSFVNVPPLLDPTWGYNAPVDEGDMCQCNVISYNLMAGCTWCQVGNTLNWVDEGTWEGGCGDVYNSDGLSFAQIVEVIPPFAYKVWNGGQWDAALASSAASLPIPTQTAAETTLSRSLPPLSTPSPISITPVSPQASAGPTSHTNATSFSSSPSASSTTSPFQPDSPSQAAKWGPIIGGITGGTFLLVLLFGLYRWYKSQHQPKSAKPKRIPYPYPQYTRSISNIFGSASKPNDGEDEYDRKRVTELMSDPRSFVASRPAPVPEGRYLTTTERLRERPISFDSDTDGVTEFGREDAYTPRGQGGLIVLSPSQHHTRMTQDFGRPTSSVDSMRDLPSLYDPPTGAPRYMSMTRSSSVLGGRETLISPMSRYPVNERGVSGFETKEGRVGAVGEALESGRERDRFSRGLVPVPGLLRGVSEESV